VLERWQDTLVQGRERRSRHRVVVIRFANPKGIDFPYLLSMIHDSFMCRPNIIVAPGGKMELAMQLILTPMILKMMDVRRRAIGAQPLRVTV